MTDETQVTEVAPAEEQKSGMGASGFIGGVAAGTGAYIGMDNYYANNGIRKVINPKPVDAKDAKDAAKDAVAEVKPEAAPAVEAVAEKTETVAEKAVDSTKKEAAKVENKFEDLVKRAGAEGDKTKASRESLKHFNDLKGIKADQVNKVVVDAEKEGFHAVTFHTKDGASETLKIAKADIGKEFTVGEHTAEDAIKKLVGGEKNALKTLTERAEKSAVKNIRKVDGFFSGFKNTSGGGKAAIIGVTLVGAYAGAKVFHAIFGGKHTNKVEEQQQAPQQAPAIG